MPILSDYAKDVLSRAIVARAPALPTAVYLGLGTGGGATTGVTGEPTTNGYARQRVIFTGTGVQRNTENIRFTFTGSVGTLSFGGLFDAASGGNPLTYGPLTSSVAVSGPGTVTVNAETFTVAAE